LSIISVRLVLICSVLWCKVTTSGKGSTCPSANRVSALKETIVWNQVVKERVSCHVWGTPLDRGNLCGSAHDNGVLVRTLTSPSGRCKLVNVKKHITEGSSSCHGRGGRGSWVKNNELGIVETSLCCEFGLSCWTLHVSVNKHTECWQVSKTVVFTESWSLWSGSVNRGHEVITVKNGVADEVNLISKRSSSIFCEEVIDKEATCTLDRLCNEGTLGLLSVVGKLFCEPIDEEVRLFSIKFTKCSEGNIVKPLSIHVHRVN